MGYIHSSSPIIIPSGSAYCPSKSGFVHPVHSVDFGAQAGARIKEIVANNRIFLNFIHFVFTKKPKWLKPLCGISHFRLLINLSVKSQIRGISCPGMSLATKRCHADCRSRLCRKPRWSRASLGSLRQPWHSRRLLCRLP